MDIKQSKESKHFFRIRNVYDNGGKTIDRYTVTFDLWNAGEKEWMPFVDNDGCLCCLCMSGRPFGGQAAALSGTCVEGRHLGERIKFADLPPDCQKCCLEYMEL